MRKGMVVKMKAKKGIVFTILGICVFLLGACGNTPKEDDIPMGRYTEREVILPGTGYEYMHPLADGGYYLQGNDVEFVKMDAEGNMKKTPWLWEKNFNVREKTVYGISDTGAVIFAFLPQVYTQEELELLGTDQEIHYQYCYVEESGERHLLELHGNDYARAETFESFAFAPDGRLYGATSNKVCRINVETGEVESLFETSRLAYEFAFIEDTMIAINRERAYLYDMVNEKLLEENTILNEFLTSHQSGSVVLATGSVTDMVTMLEQGNTENNAGDGPVLYLGCRNGLYRYIWNGSMIEQVADGQMLTLGNTQYSPVALQALSNGEFRLLFSGNYMVEMYYDETIPARPSKELVVYSLEENDMIRYAGQLFQKENPDVLVVYETGMDGDNAVNKEDAIKNLNTKLLAGEGPDVLIMDDLDIGQYAEKGMLRELDDFLASYEEEGALYQNIVEGMRMTEADKIYSVPLKVFVPLYLSETKYLEGQSDLAGVVLAVEMARKEHPDGPILCAPYPKDLLNELIPVCLPAWTMSDGSLDIDKITEFYQAAEALWELDGAGMDENARKEWQEGSGSEDSRFDLYYINTLLPYWVSFRDKPDTWIQIGYTQNPFMDMRQLHLMYYGFRVGGGYIPYKELDDVNAFGFDRYGGQAQDIYWARTIVGLCGQAKEPELAEEFLTFLLSDDMMSKWWLDDGYPIRKESLERILDIDNHEWAKQQALGSQSVGIWYSSDAWPDENEKQWLYQVMGEVSCPYFGGSVLEEAAKEVGLRVINGEMTPEEGAAEVAGRMEIEMKE